MADPLATLADIASATLLAGGAFFYLVGAVGLNRMPDLFTRMHAASVSETLGLSLLFLGLALQAGLSLVLVKLVVIYLLIMLTAPIATHALARAALHDGVRPLLADDAGRLAPADVAALLPDLAERLGAGSPDTGDGLGGLGGLGGLNGGGAANAEARLSNS